MNVHGWCRKGSDTRVAVVAEECGIEAGARARARWVQDLGSSVQDPGKSTGARNETSKTSRCVDSNGSGISAQASKTLTEFARKMLPWCGATTRNRLQAVILTGLSFTVGCHRGGTIQATKHPW